MIRSISFAWFSLAFLTITGCFGDGSKPTPTPDPKAVKERVKEMSDRYQEAAEAGGKSVAPVDPEKFSQEQGKQNQEPAK